MLVEIGLRFPNIPREHISVYTLIRRSCKGGRRYPGLLRRLGGNARFLVGEFADCPLGACFRGVFRTAGEEKVSREGSGYDSHLERFRTERTRRPGAAAALPTARKQRRGGWRALPGCTPSQTDPRTLRPIGRCRPWGAG